jgi:hypothetical protein
MKIIFLHSVTTQLLELAHQIQFYGLEHIGLRERVLFIGTQFSILYTSMYAPNPTYPADAAPAGEYMEV